MITSASFTFRLALRRTLRCLVVMLAMAGPQSGCSESSDDDGGGISVCGDGVCDERASTCPEDCAPEVDAGVDAPATVCGNHVCEQNEPASCPGDCTTCGNHVCEVNEPASCPGDCTTCGNHVCETGENASCPGDCTTCGNHVCETGENASCPGDCTVCGNNVCETGEAASCPGDCTSTLAVRNNSTYRMYKLFVAPCGAPNWGINQLGTSTIAPSGGTFTLNRIPPGCYFFRTESGTFYWQTPAAVNLGPGQTYTWTLVN